MGHLFAVAILGTLIYLAYEALMSKRNDKDKDQ